MIAQTSPQPQPQASGLSHRPSASLADRRDHERIDIRARATAHAHGVFQTVLIRNVSCGGVMLETAFGLAIGDSVVIRTMNGNAYAGLVAWSVSPYTGVSFDVPITRDDPLFAPRFRVMS
ncbi:MAG: PilZ domain-containing protein [Pseudomonadota bacterium]